MLPHGTRIIKRIKSAIRNEYQQDGFEEIQTPLIYKKDIWETSGHWQNYKDDMFVVNDLQSGRSEVAEGSANESVNEDVFGLKPMSCPAHCVVFGSTTRSYRELPLRLADFTALHRNEATGALSGLTRLRQFHQDDGHIFCHESHVFTEIKKTLDMIDRVYRKLGFKEYNLALSTRPQDAFLGTVSDWEQAEEALTQALQATGRYWTIKEGDGAFYGPKIDISVLDAMQRHHQTATIQLDFQLPQRFSLNYQNEHGDLVTPVLIHRAVLGSLERMLAILIEHHSGRWPFWLSPRQAVVIPVSLHPDILAYASTLQALLSGKRIPDNSAIPMVAQNCRHIPSYHVDLDSSDNLLNKKIRDAQMHQYNMALIVGEKEKNNGTVSVRHRQGKKAETMTVGELLDLFIKMEQSWE
jgi:threonyl-tRNA synthetase